MGDTRFDDGGRKELNAACSPGSTAEEPTFARLSAGGNRIRTIGPARVKGLSAVADERCRTDKLDGVIKRRSSRETMMVGRGVSLDGRLFLGGTDGSNPVPSSRQSVSRGISPCGIEKLAVAAGCAGPGQAARPAETRRARRNHANCG